MAEYIDKQALLSEYDRVHVGPPGGARKLIEVAPAADVVPAVHGRWVDKMVRDWHCSECGKKVPRQVYFDGYCYDDKLNYCPNCGAKMDGE